MTPEAYIIPKWLWTEADFDLMGWHDSTLHGIAFYSNQFEIAFDIDYILKWVQPSEDKYYRFWIAPATLVFENVHELKLDLEPYCQDQIMNISRDDQRRLINADHVKREVEWRWHIETLAGEISLRSVGYMQYIRREPVYCRSQSLDINARGGISFGRGKQ